MRRIATIWLLPLFLLFACAEIAFAQERTVSGSVTDAATDQPLPGVNVILDGTTRGTTTGVNGDYSIRVDSDEDVLVFSFVGYETLRETVSDREVIDVALQEDIALLEDIVVVGYGQRRRADVTGAVGSVDVESARAGRVVNPEQMMQGRLAGVNITPSDGSPGSGALVRIRGGTSISASNEPLWVIDGVPIDAGQGEPGGSSVSQQPPRSPLNMINPNDIESIDILKDASAAAIYGSRGANGVIMITTRQGREGQMQVDYDGSVSAAALANRVPLLSAGQFRTLAQEADANIPDENVETDWQDAISRTAVSHTHNLAIAGGTAETRYRASLGYQSNQGIVINSGQERVTGRLNANHTTIDGRLRLGINATGSHIQDENLPYQQTGGFTGGFFTNLMKMAPTVPVYNEDGTHFEYGGEGIRNPVALAELIEDFTNTTRTIGNIHGEFDIVPGLFARVNVGLDRTQASRRIYVPRASKVGQPMGGEATQRNRERSSQLIELTGNYRGSFVPGHAVELVGGYSFQEFHQEEFGATMRDFITDRWRWDNLAGGADDTVTPYSFRESSRLVSFFARGNYDIDDRFLLTATVRYDGSSRFGADHKWGLFPSASVGWRLSNEPFLAGVGGLSNLMLRVSYGITGSQEIGNYRSLPTMAPDPDFRAVIGGSEVVGVAPNNFPNPALHWEETSSFNAGLDYGLQHGRLQGSLEFYVKNTSGLLIEFDVPQPAVVDTRLENAGEVRNMGLEFSADWLMLDDPDFNLSIGGNVATNHNEVVSLGGRDRIITGSVSGAGQSGVNAMLITPGHPIGTFYGFRFVEVNDNGEQLFEELDADGNVVGTTTDPDTERDRQVIGNSQPDLTYGLNAQLNVGNFDAGVFLRGVHGIDIFNNTALEYTLKNNVTTGINLWEPALHDGTSVEEAGVFSSRWMEDGSFLRIDNVTVGYTFANIPQVQVARVYVSAQNLFTFTGYTGWDPEVHTDAGLETLGMDYTTYPRDRTFTLGVSLGF